jgi:hypothetical protein
MKKITGLLSAIMFFLLSSSAYSQYKPVYLLDGDAFDVVKAMTYNDLMETDARILAKNKVSEVVYYDSSMYGSPATMVINKNGRVIEFSKQIPVYGKLYQTFTYDGNGRITGMSQWLNDTLRKEMKYKYKDGNLISAELTYPESEVFSYTFSYKGAVLDKITIEGPIAGIYDVSYDESSRITGLKDQAGITYSEIKYTDADFSMTMPTKNFEVKQKDGRLVSEYFNAPTLKDAEHTETFYYKENGLIDYSMSRSIYGTDKIYFDYKYR